MKIVKNGKLADETNVCRSGHSSERLRILGNLSNVEVSGD
jgi:hypothetical protein